MEARKLRTRRSSAVRVADLVAGIDSWGSELRMVAGLASGDSLVVGADSDVDSCLVDTAVQATEDKLEFPARNMELAAAENFRELVLTPVAGSSGLAAKSEALAFPKLVARNMETERKSRSVELEPVDSETWLEIAGLIDCC